MVSSGAGPAVGVDVSVGEGDVVGVGDAGDGVSVGPAAGVDVAGRGETVGDGSVAGAHAARPAIRMSPRTINKTENNLWYTV
jgi:hypothetical protein